MKTNQEKKEIFRMQHEIKQLQRSVKELIMLNEIAIAINSTLSLNRILDLIIQKCMEHLNVEQSAIMLLDEKEKEKPFKTVVRRGDTVSTELPYRLDSQLTGWMLKNQKSLLINDFMKSKQFRRRGKEVFPVHSLLCSPLHAKGRMIGILALFNARSKEGFSETDRRFLSIISTESAQVIENARLLEEEQALIRMQEELRLAYDIQTNLLPKKAPLIEGYHIVGRSIPAKEVGGDYFDFFPINHSRLGFCLGDVSGKGMPAALLMASLQATIRGQTLFNPVVKDCIQRSNTLMFQNTSSEKFATLFYGILNTRSHHLCYSNAGHNYPILFAEREKKCMLESNGMALGCMETVPFAEEKIPICPGDLLLLYSDGITEAMNADEKEFGEIRLVDIIKENWNESVETIVNKILQAVRLFTGDSPQTDDMTLLIVKRLKK